MDKLPFSNDSVKEDNEPREPWAQEGITKFSPVKDKEIVERVREHSQTHAEGYKKGYEDGKCDSNKERIEWLMGYYDGQNTIGRKFLIAEADWQALKRGEVEQK